jgi:hypothetical protein
MSFNVQQKAEETPRFSRSSPKFPGSRSTDPEKASEGEDFIGSLATKFSGKRWLAHSGIALKNLSGCSIRNLNGRPRHPRSSQNDLARRFGGPVGWVDSSICYTSAPDWVSRACASNDSIAEEEADEAGKNADWENNRARALEQQTAFNLQRWLELQSDPDLAHLPHWIETDRYGHILIKLRLDTCVQVGDVL